MAAVRVAGKAAGKASAQPEPDRPADTEQRILDAAHRVFMARGTAGARMQDIAREAGVNQALLHYYFRSKERLAEAVFRRATSDLLPPLIAILGDPRIGLRDKVTRVVHHEIDQLSRTPYLPGYLLGELSQYPQRGEQLIALLTGIRPSTVVPGVLETVERQLRAAQRKGEIRATTPQDFLITVMSMCIFPFIARPMLETLFQWNDEQWTSLLARRRRELPEIILGALRR